MLNSSIETDKMVRVTEVIDGVGIAVKSNIHINELIKQSNTVITAEFVLHMSREAIANPLKFGHMYEWGGIGDPNARLWKHILRGRGAQRQLTFDFKASVKKVPVSSKLRDVGVQQNHIFTWKAPVLELGLPVSISPQLSKTKTLVFESAFAPMGSQQRNGLVFYKGTVNIPRQGNDQTWNSFTNEFRTWFSSEAPGQLIKQTMTELAQATIKKSFVEKIRTIRSTKTKVKNFTLTPVGVDKNFADTLAKSLTVNYISGAASRRVVVAEDER